MNLHRVGRRNIWRDVGSQYEGNRYYTGIRDDAGIIRPCDGPFFSTREAQMHIAEMAKRSSAARVLGRIGGQAHSEAKTRAVRENGKKGGRPRKVT
jgi:hypothetical protein